MKTKPCNKCFKSFTPFGQESFCPRCHAELRIRHAKWAATPPGVSQVDPDAPEGGPRNPRKVPLQMEGSGEHPMSEGDRLGMGFDMIGSDNR